MNTKENSMTDKEKLDAVRAEVQNYIYAARKAHTNITEGNFAHLLSFIDSLQEEPVSGLDNGNMPVERWEQAVKAASNQRSYRSSKGLTETRDDYFVDGVQWADEHLWKPADGDDLPEIDREVIALLDNGKVVFAHRPSEYWNGKNIDTGKVTRYYPKTFDKGGWNIPNIVYWLDVELPKEIEL